MIMSVSVSSSSLLIAEVRFEDMQTGLKVFF